MRCSLVIPTYNEKENLRPLIERAEAALARITDDYELLFVDDSTDETPEILAEMSRNDPHIRVIHREEKSGLASAVVCGFENAKGETIAVMDADLQHPPELLADMLTVIDDGADIVLPSRYISGGESEGLSFIRTLASKGAKYAARIFLPSMRKVSDPMSGFFMFRRGIIDGVQLNPIGWKILMEVLAMGNYQHVVEIPYEFEKRNAGESKLSLKVTIEYFLHILALAARGTQERRRYALLLSCLLGVLADVLVFWAVQAIMPLHAAASLSVLACALVVILCYQMLLPKRDKKEKSSRGLSYGILIITLAGLKNVFLALLSWAGIVGFSVNLWACALAVCIYALLVHRRIFMGTHEPITYEVRATSVN